MIAIAIGLIVLGLCLDNGLSNIAKSLAYLAELKDKRKDEDIH